MKTLTILTSALVIVAISASSGCKKDKELTQQYLNPILNYDFEEWSWDPLPINWQTNSCPLCMPQWDPYIVKKDSQIVFHGKYSAKLIYNLTIPTPGCQPCEPGCCIASGRGQPWIKNKFAITEHPSILHGYVKCDVHGIDTVFIKIKLLNKSIPVDSGQWISTASMSNWTEINIPISHSASTIDSALILIAGGKYKDSTTTLRNSTTLWVDYLTIR